MAIQKVKRSDLQHLSRIRINEAEHLLRAQSFPGAYYLTGVAVECALKACIARATEQFEFPNLEKVRDSWNHDLTKLLNTAGLLSEHRGRSALDADFNTNWLTVKDWNVSSRYEKRSSQEAQSIFDAATDAQHGILAWIEEYW
jgi:hypothetical protein